jgi:hypothetical protein
MATRSRVALKKNSDAKEMTLPPVALEKRTSAAEAVKRRLFTARLKPCPSLDGLFPELLGSPKGSCAGQIGQFEKSNLDRSEVQPSLRDSAWK